MNNRHAALIAPTQCAFAHGGEATRYGQGNVPSAAGPDQNAADAGNTRSLKCVCVSVEIILNKSMGNFVTSISTVGFSRVIRSADFRHSELPRRQH